MMVMSSKTSNQDAWQRCPSGELSRMVGRIGLKRRRRVLTQTVAVAVVVLLGGVTAWQFFPNTHDFSYGDITCSEIEDELQQYLAHRLPAGRAEQFRLHLEQCPRCKKLVEQMMSEAGQPVVLASDGLQMCHGPRNSAGPVILAAGRPTTVFPSASSAHAP
jgi:hypothetical protein